MSDLKNIVMHRPLKEIAADIYNDWENVSPYADAYLRPMLSLNQITEAYGVDSASYVVNYFLANARSWKGETAREIKKELKSIVKLLDDERLQRIANQNVERAYRS